MKHAGLSVRRTPAKRERPARHVTTVLAWKRPLGWGARVGPLTNLGGHRQGLVVKPLREQLGVHAGQLVLVPRCRAERGRPAVTPRVRKTALSRGPRGAVTKARAEDT